MTKSYRDITRSVSASTRKLRADLPDFMKGWSGFAHAALAGGVLDMKTKELIALALGVASHCDACLGYHVQALVKLGRPAPRSRKRWPLPSTWAAGLRSCTQPTR